MSEQEAGAGVAVAERDVDAAEDDKPKRGWFGRGKKQDVDDEPEHEIEFMTPFGKLELEFEPTTKKEERDRKKREKAEREAAKAEAAAAKRAEQEAEDAKKRPSSKQVEVVAKSGGAGKLIVILAVLGLIAAAIGVAVWLFARKPEDLERVPPEYRAVELEPEPEGFVPKMRHRLRHALREGQQASREAQMEQQQRYEDLTQGG
jgi:uncharacterized protein HemX